MRAERYCEWVHVKPRHVEVKQPILKALRVVDTRK